MRVIAGKYKGRKLNTPVGYDIRPTADKVKEALFSILSNDIYGSRVLDLFAGTGGLGIEALSRGASYCAFCDSSRMSLNLVKENIAHCQIEEEVKVVPGDYRKVLEGMAAKIADGLEEAFDIIILDPPYDQELYDDAFRLISEGGVLAEDGIIVAEHRKEKTLPENFSGFVKQKERRYGSISLSIYK